MAFLANIELTGISAIGRCRLEPNINEINVAKFFSHNHALILIMPYLSYLDCLSLVKALAKLVPTLSNKLPPFATVIGDKLKAIGVQVELTKILIDSGAVLTGSFLMHCLLQPLSSDGWSTIFPFGSDIDLLSTFDNKRRVNCNYCLTKLIRCCNAPEQIQLLDPGSQFNWVVKYGRQRLGLPNVIKPKLVLSQLIYDLYKNKTDKYDLNNLKFPHLSCLTNTKISTTLCPHLTFINKSRSYDNLNITNRLVWSCCQNVKVDDVCVDAPKGIHQWIYDNVDFDFCKNSFDGIKLCISHPLQLIRRSCHYNLDLAIVSSISGYINFSTTPTSSYLQKCYDLLKVYTIRSNKYFDKGFSISFNVELEVCRILQFINKFRHERKTTDEIFRWTARHLPY